MWQTTVLGAKHTPALSFLVTCKSNNCWDIVLYPPLSFEFAHHVSTKALWSFAALIGYTKGVLFNAEGWPLQQLLGPSLVWTVSSL